MNVIDLFCGCGGLSLGFNMAGFNILAAIDNDPDSLNTILKNELSKNAINLDLFDSDWIRKLSSKIPINEVDVIIGGPPCQGFSLTGTRDFNDKRNKLYLSMYDAVKSIKPKAFLIENVKGMANLYDGKVKNEIVKIFENIGYKVNFSLLNSKHYGVPQSRERMFFVGLIDDYYKFPEKINLNENLISCEEALSDLPSLLEEHESTDYLMAPDNLYQKFMRRNTKALTNHVATNHTEHVINVIKQVPDGGNHKDLPPGVGDSRKFNEAWTRYHSKSPSRTIDTGHRNHFHYKYNRVPTVRENCRLQSFPDNYKITGSKTSQNRQVGNAVPVLLSYCLARSIYEQI